MCPPEHRREGDVRDCVDAVVLLDFLVRFRDIFVLSCGLRYLESLGNFNAVSDFLMLFCAVLIRISVRFCGVPCPPSLRGEMLLTLQHWSVNTTQP